MNEITRLRHEGLLPDHIKGHRRNTLIRKYQIWKGLDTAPKNIHPAIAWSAQAPMKLLLPVDDDVWSIIKTDSKNKPITQAKAREALVNRVCIPALGSTAVAISCLLNVKRMMSEMTNRISKEKLSATMRTYIQSVSCRIT